MIRAVLFDLDGTLLDTAPDLIGSLNYLRVSEGLSILQEADYKHCVSRGALGLISAGMPESSKEVYEQRKTDFLRHYEQNIFKKTRPFNGVENMLDELDRRAIPWGIVTNKMEYLTFPLLKAAKILSRAACVICGDTLRQSKPHPAPVLLGCEIIGSNSNQTLMVGDDLRDIQAGNAAGTSTALATYGYLDPAVVVEDLTGSFLLSQPSDVLELLE
ncbi:MAG: 2-phosphoglycolate phosphatase [Rhodothermales bacterium]